VACRDVGVELWRTDGSPSGTSRIAVLDAQSGYGCVSEMASIGGRLYFLLNTGLDSADLWTSDGTEGGTGRLKAAPANGPSFHHLTPLGANLIFSLDDETICFDCGDPGSTWRTDGTPEGTYKIEEFGFGGAAVVGEDIYLLAPFGLYRTNGERAMAVSVVDFLALPEPGGADPASCPGFVRLDGTFYFALSTQVQGGSGNCALERSDGTQAGTKLLNDELFTISDLFPFDHRVFFVAEPADGNDDQEIWQTTGTPAGTGVVRDLNPEGYAGAYPTILATTPDGVFFVADDGVTGQQFYRVRP
jgi:ELWxxDGT repeat protein